MIFRSFFIIIILLVKSFFITNFLFAKDPMSAIDWLAEKINDPPDFYTNPSLNFDINDNDIKKLDIPNISKNSIGIFPSIRLGINSNVWKNSNEFEISSLLEAGQKLIISTVIANDFRPPMLDAINFDSSCSNFW